MDLNHTIGFVIAGLQSQYYVWYGGVNNTSRKFVGILNSPGPPGIWYILGSTTAKTDSQTDSVINT